MSSVSDAFRDLLLDILSDSDELKNVTREISETTLRRWLQGAHKPQSTKLHRLLSLLSDDSRKARLQSFLDLTSVTSPGVKIDYDTIPSTFYTRILSIVTDSPPSLWWAICDLALRQALSHVDGERIGMQISLVRCVLLKDEKVSALREILTFGTPPWSSYEVEQSSIFFGIESLAGKCVSSFRMLVDVEKDGGVEGLRFGVAAIPIFKGGRVGGCLYVKSIQTDFFTPARCNLLQQYAGVCALAFRCQDMREQSDFALVSLPSKRVQLPLLAHLGERKNALMRQGLSVEEATQILTQQIVTELRLL